MRRIKDEGRSVSRFFVTVNSNRTPEEAKELDFPRRVEKFLKHIDRMLRYREGFEADPDMKTNIDYEYEVGGAKKRLHVHAIVEFRHSTNLSFDMEKLTEWSGKYGFHVNVRYVKNQDLDGLKMQKYVGKGVPQKKKTKK